MTRWFTSDLHLGDPWAAGRRYCKDNVPKMNDWLASRWDKNIAAEDEVFILGDVIAGMSLADFTIWLNWRPGRKHLILGNQDVAVEPRLAVWESVGFESAAHERMLTLLDGRRVLMSHYPQPSGQTLHGHTHKQAKITRPGMVHVGWEAWRRYVPEKDVVESLRLSQVPISKIGER